MKPIRTLAALLLPALLGAQAPSREAIGTLVVFGEVVQTREILLAPGIGDQAARQTGPGLRLLGRIEDHPRWQWELVARFQNSERMVTHHDIASAPPANILDVTQVKVDYSYYGAGAGYLMPLSPATDLGFHLELRAETINPKGSYSTTNGGKALLDAMTVWARPWVRVSLDTAFPVGGVTTVVGGELGVATLRASQHAILPMSQIDRQTLRALAPDWSLGLYAGVRF